MAQGIHQAEALSRRELEALRRSVHLSGREFADIVALKAIEEETWGPSMRRLFLSGLPLAAQGIHYWDKVEPLFTADATAVTLATTDKLLIPAAFTNSWSAGFGGKPGKTIYLDYIGVITTVLTPGNIGVELYWGGTDAGGTLLGNSTSLGLSASQTQILFRVEARCTNRGPFGTACALEAYAVCKFGTAVIASPNDHFFVPASTLASVNADVTAASFGFNAQIKRSGSTAESVTMKDVIALVS